MKDRKNVAFLITAFDQLREVKFTVHMLRNLWSSTAKSPIVVVISGDNNRDLVFNDDPYTRVVHVDDMVGDKFQILVSTSIAKQIEHGMIEVRDLERAHGDIDSIVHIHGDILLLREEGFFNTFDAWRVSGLPVAADNVSPNGPYHLELFEKKYQLTFHGQELMPQLFAVDHAFCKSTSYMYSMPVMGSLEEISTEWMLIGNLHRAAAESGEQYGPLDKWDAAQGPYSDTFKEFVSVVKKNRSQWDLHAHWGGFTHFGNSLHFTKEHREHNSEMAMKRYGLDLSEW